MAVAGRSPDASENSSVSTGVGAHDESSVMARRRRVEDGGGAIAGSESMRTAFDWMLLTATDCGDLPVAGEWEAFEFTEARALFWRLPICCGERTGVSIAAARELSRALSSVGSQQLCQGESTRRLISLISISRLL